MKTNRFALRKRSRQTRQERVKPAAPTRTPNETLACPCCELKLLDHDDALWEHVHTEHTTMTHVSGVEVGTPLFMKMLRDEALYTAKALRGREIAEPSTKKGQSYRTSQYRVRRESRLKTHTHHPSKLSSASPKGRRVHPILDCVVPQPLPADEQRAGLVLGSTSQPISQEQLLAEVDSIYAGIKRIESRCIREDSTQVDSIRNSPCGQRIVLAPAHWQALVGLHHALLCEHHDFFLASHHPSASPDLRHRSIEWSMPARMWKYGIYSLLELLRQCLPESLEYLLSFTFMAYQMITFLYEAIPAFEGTWVDYLKAIAHYRMEIAGEDRQDRETWAAIAHFWNRKPADKGPFVDRLGRN